MKMDYIRDQVKELLGAEGTGHDWEHIRRVTATAVMLAKQENADLQIVEAAALLHDVDDRKISGDINTEKELPTARRLMKEAGASEEQIATIVSLIHSLGFHKSLGGVKPETLEAKIVSDADYLDAIGAIGVARCCAYGGSKGRNIFLPEITPTLDISQSQYVNQSTPTINHFFEKLLKLKDKIHTDAGRIEAAKRHHYMLVFLENFFREADAGPVWSDMLKKYA